MDLQEQLDALSNDQGALLGARCSDCGTACFPLRSSCERCGSTTLEMTPLPDCGDLWSWTSQNFPPSSHPSGLEFKPYLVGYVNLGELLVLARLDYPCRSTPALGDILSLDWATLALEDGELRMPVFRKGGPR